MSYQPPTLAYRRTEELDPDQEHPVKRAADEVFGGITWAVLMVLLALWAFVGAVFWIPLMLRAMFRFALSLVQAVRVGKRPEGAARGLRDAVSFYRRGFMVAVETVTKMEIDPDAKDPDTGNLLFRELLWAIPIWYVIFLWIGWIQTSPLDAWHWWASIEWGEVFRVADQAVRG